MRGDYRDLVAIQLLILGLANQAVPVRDPNDLLRWVLLDVNNPSFTWVVDQQSVTKFFKKAYLCGEPMMFKGFLFSCSD